MDIPFWLIGVVIGGLIAISTWQSKQAMKLLRPKLEAIGRLLQRPEIVANRLQGTYQNREATLRLKVNELKIRLQCNAAFSLKVDLKRPGRHYAASPEFKTLQTGISGWDDGYVIRATDLERCLQLLKQPKAQALLEVLMYSEDPELDVHAGQSLRLEWERHWDHRPETVRQLLEAMAELAELLENG